MVEHDSRIGCFWDDGILIPNGNAPIEPTSQYRDIAIRKISHCLSNFSEGDGTSCHPSCKLRQFVLKTPGGQKALQSLEDAFTTDLED